MPVPRVRLVAFERVHVKAGASATVQLAVKPNTYSVVYPNPDVYKDSRQVEKGSIELSVGGGQPDYVKVLKRVVNITGSAPLSSC